MKTIELIFCSYLGVLLRLTGTDRIATLRTEAKHIK